MAKDPAFLFYSQDFITGTLAMPFDERGRYITLLCYQHQTGRMSEETIRFLIGSFSDTLRLKFKRDESGLFYNERLETEIEKRTKFIESRVNNGKLGGRPKESKKPLAKPLGLPSANLIENENINENIDLIYNEYPSKCPINNRSTGKCSKDKDKIRKLLSIHDVNHLLEVIKLYIQDSINTKTYIKNFGTFLNNLPDINELKKGQILTCKKPGNFSTNHNNTDYTDVGFTKR